MSSGSGVNFNVESPQQRQNNNNNNNNVGFNNVDININNDYNQTVDSFKSYPMSASSQLNLFNDSITFNTSMNSQMIQHQDMMSFLNSSADDPTGYENPSEGFSALSVDSTNSSHRSSSSSNGYIDSQQQQKHHQQQQQQMLSNNPHQLQNPNLFQTNFMESSYFTTKNSFQSSSPIHSFDQNTKAFVDYVSYLKRQHFNKTFRI